MASTRKDSVRYSTNIIISTFLQIILYKPDHALNTQERLVNLGAGTDISLPFFQFHRYPTSIASLSFSNDGSLLAIASSYMYEEDAKE